jgi:hypothetical protein
MSQRNGDRARFQKERKRKLRRRQRTQQLLTALGARTPKPVGLVAAAEGQPGFRP